MEDAKVTINQQVKSSDDKGKIEAKLNTTLPVPQALSNGTLPDDFYLHLLSVMGIQECLLSNRLVCSFWNDLVLDRCNNQKALKLFETFKCLMNYGELLLRCEKTDDPSLILKSVGDDLLFEAIEIDHVQLVKSLHQDDDENEEGDIQKVLNLEKKLEASKVLTALFPKVEELVLCTEEVTLINIEHLLQFYAEQLTSLTMPYFGPWSERPGSKLRAFSFPKLKSLNTFWFFPEKEQLLSLLPQLESLTLAFSEISLETLLRTGTQLRELNIRHIHSVYTEPEDEFSKCPPINSNLRKFTLGLKDNVLQILEFISRNLSSLECIKLFFGHLYSLHLLTSYLVPLHQLHSLTLDARVSFFLLDDPQLAEIQPLPSVRQLKLLLRDYDSLSLESMDLFSRALFTAFPNAEQVLIAFVGCEEYDIEYDGHVDAATLAAFEDFAGKHPNVVQLIRSNDMSKFTTFPNSVSPLLGHRRQVYEEYIEEVELFGFTICKLAASLVTRQGDDPNLKIALRPADRLSALSNLLQLLESEAFAFTFEMVNTMIQRMLQCALTYGSSQVALFIVTCKCFLSLLDCSVVDTFNSDKETPFLDTRYCHVYSLFKMMLKLVKHYQTQQYDDKSLFLQLCKRMVELLTEFDRFIDDEQVDEFKMFKILLKLADYYKTQHLNVLDNEEEVLLQIYNLVDEQLKMFESEKRLDRVIRKLICSEKRVYRVEMVRVLLRGCESTDNCSDSSDSTTTSDGSSSSAESKQ